MVRRFWGALFALLLAQASSFGQSTYSWNLDANGTWDTTTINWLLASTPSAWSNGANTASFGGVITANRTITVAAGGVTAGALSFSNTGSLAYTLQTGPITLNNGASDSFINIGRGVLGAATYSGTGGQTVASAITFNNNLNITNDGAFGTTNLTLSGAIARSAAGGSIIVNGQGNTSISGAIGNTITGGITKNGTGTLNLSNITNSFSGGITVNGGVVAIAAANDLVLGNTANGVTLNNGGTLRFGSAVTLASTRVITINGSAANPSGLDLSSAVTQVIGANQLSGSGTATISITNGTTAGFLSVEGANSGFTGSLNVGTPGLQLVGSTLSQRIFSQTAATTLRLQNVGTLSGATGVTVNNGAELRIVQPTTAVTGRLSSAMPITLNGGRFTYNSSTNGGAAVNESFGALNVSGLARISAFTGTGTTGGTTLTFASLNRTGLSTVFFTGSGTAFGGTPSATTTNYKVTGFTALTGLGTTSAGVIPWASIVSTTTDPTNMVTYDGNGFRPLNLTTETVTVAGGGSLTAGANNNLQGTITLTGDTAINSLLNSTGTPVINGTGTLTITSGGMSLFNGLTVNGPNIRAAAGSPLYWNLGFPGAVSGGTSQLLGDAGVSVSALSASTSYRLTLNNTTAGGNPFTGGLFVNGQAQVAFTLADDQLGSTAAGNGITLNGGQLLFTPGSAITVPLGTNRTINVAEANGTIGTSVANANLQIPSLISGPGQLQFGGGLSSNASGIVELTNTSANTYSGGTVVSSGILRISNPNQLGTGAVYLNSGTLQAGAGLTFANAPIMTGSSTIDTQANTVILSNGLNGSGGTLGTSATAFTLSKTGSGTLNITGTGNYAGSITLGNAAGALTINGNGRMPELGPVALGLNSTLNIDNSSTNISDRTGRTTNLTLSNSAGAAAGGATVNLTTNSAGSTFTFGSLTVNGGTATNANTSIFNLIDGGSGNNTITFNSLTAIAANNTLNIVGTTNFGRDTAGGTRIFFLTPPTLTGGAIANVNFTGFGGSGFASYDPVLGVILLATSSGTFIDNITNVGPGSITPTNTAFTTTGATTANLGATIKSLAIAGHTVTMVPNVNTPQSGNANAPANSLVLTGGGLTSNTAASTITSATATTIQFGATNAGILATTDLTIAANVTLAGSNGMTKTGAGVLNINGPYSITGLATVSAGTVNFNTGAVLNGLAGSGATVSTPTGQTLSFTGTGTATYSGILDGGASINTAAGFTGLQVLSGANTITGSVTVNGGTLASGSAGALGVAGNTAPFTVASGATLGFQGGVISTATNPTSIAGVGATGRSGAIDNISGVNTFAAPITIASGTTIGSTAGTLTLSGGVIGTNANLTATGAGNVLLTTAAMNLGTGTLSKTGAGVFGLPNFANTLGNTTITGGLVRAAADNNFGATTNSILMNGGGFQYGDVAFAFDNSRSVTVGAAGGTIDTNALSPTFAYNLTGTGNLTKSGAGTLTITTTQSYVGNTTITGGVVTLGINNALPTNLLTIGNINASNTDTQLNLGGFNQTVSGLTITARGSGSVSAVTGAGILTVNGPIAYVDNTAAAGNAFQANINATVTAIDLGGAIRNITVAGQNNGTNPGDFTINTVIQNGGINFTGNNSSTIGAATGMLLNAGSANTYSLGTTVNAGTLTVAAATTLGTGGGLMMNQSGTVVSSVGLNSAQTLTSLSTGTINSSASTTLTLTGATTILTVNQSSNTTFGGVISGTGGLTKTGTGTLTLGGVNTYTAATTVDGGTLRINGSTAAGSAVTVNSGAFIGGSGTINGALTINAGGGVASGNSIGTLTVNNNLTINGNPAPTTTQWNIELNGVAPNTVATADQTNVDRLILTGGTSILNFNTSATNRITINVSQLGGSFTLLSPVSYRIATVATAGNIQTAGGAFDSSHFDFTASGFAFDSTPTISIDGTHMVLTFVPTPEPTTIMALGLASLAGLGYVRRRRKSTTI